MRQTFGFLVLLTHQGLLVFSLGLQEIECMAWGGWKVVGEWGKGGGGGEIKDGSKKG